MYLLTKSFC